MTSKEAPRFMLFEKFASPVQEGATRSQASDAPLWVPFRVGSHSTRRSRSVCCTRYMPARVRFFPGRSSDLISTATSRTLILAAPLHRRSRTTQVVPVASKPLYIMSEVICSIAFAPALTIYHSSPIVPIHQSVIAYFSTAAASQGAKMKTSICDIFTRRLTSKN